MLKKNFCIVLNLLLATIIFSPAANATVVKQEPWNPIAASYLRSLFYLNLKPVDWDRVAEEYRIFEVNGYKENSEYNIFTKLKDFTGEDHGLIIRKAIRGKNSEEFYNSSTRAISQLIRYHLQEALVSLGTPSISHREVSEAKQLYRAFEDFIEQLDPVAYKKIGIAWLDLVTGIGSEGIFGIARKEPDMERFSSSRRVIEQYLINNYEVKRTDFGDDFTPLPLKAVEEKSKIELKPWLPPGSDLTNQDPLPRLVLNIESRGIDEKELFLVAYGDMLFDSPEIFGEPARSLGITCSTCHNRSDINQRFFIPGISAKPGTVDVDGHFFNPRFNDHRNDPLDIPSLRGLRFTAPYGRDGRFASLRDFVRNVIVNEFRGDEPTPFMLDALFTYMLEFDWLPSPFLNPDGTLNDRTSKSARRGEELFNSEFKAMGGRACSTCHVLSSNFMDGLRHDIGSGNPSSPGARDSFFDTPTLINVKYTAPYFHDGSHETLYDVVVWFDESFNLGLSKKQKRDLTTYLETVGTGERPFEIFDEENTLFLLDWGELSTFLSTLNSLLPMQDKTHTKILLRTVSRDLKVDAIGLKDLSQSTMVYELSQKLDEILDAVESDDWKRSRELWLEYQSLEKEYGSKFK